MGAGFAVVAEEIRKLADTSNKKTKEISQLIKEMNHTIDGSASVVNSVGNSLLEITDKVDKTTPLINDITKRIGLYSASYEEIMKENIKLNEISNIVNDKNNNELKILDSFSNTFLSLQKYFSVLYEIIIKMIATHKESTTSIESISQIRKENNSVGEKIKTLLHFNNAK